MSITESSSPENDWAPGALDGLVVADFTRVLAGPYATMMLADLGADVVKIERPGAGDDTRTWGPPFTADGTATYFASVNRNKKSVTLDLRDPDDLARAREIALQADVVIENFRAGRWNASVSDTTNYVRENQISCTARSPDSVVTGAQRCPDTTCSFKRSAD